MATFITPVALTTSSSAAWTDIDVSANVPVGAVGVILRLEKTAVVGMALGFRKNGSTDNRTNAFSTNSANDGHIGILVGLDANRIFEYYIGNVSNAVLTLVGYFDGGAVFFDNAVDKSTATTGSYVDVDISADTGGDTAIAAIVEALSSGPTSRTLFLRKNGSTDDIPGENFGARLWGVVGVDGSEIFEQRINSAVTDLFLVGYFTSGVVLHTNMVSRVTATVGSYEDVAALDAGAVGGIYWANNASATTVYDYDLALRKNGAADDIYRGVPHQGYYYVECDGSGVVDQKIEDANIDLFELGYFLSTVAPAFSSRMSLTGVGG
jgi:hypothetical protein